ncbi:Krueppel-like factor 15 [Colletotrichum orbiculare MAFF 240422]|uniref:Krueppel-like factor 15 n=1 Tax=Colletotrichum orbiculare (strain 104-T / ATCC 96160 / CBS 514.97 / LARS 414 / MAFF 240422) TaxID=1213857 RepID=A0A484G9S4_COLOR|nr:Krueppel-like factor 15 [Colletotrichum orbiculare MAFF 240422]
MYRGLSSTSSLHIPDNTSRSPSDSVDLPSPLDNGSTSLGMSSIPSHAMAAIGSNARRSNAPAPWGLVAFYKGTDNPWVPLVSGSEAQQPQHLSLQTRENPAFTGWRTPQPSECGTIPQAYLPSDSGYESRAKHSIDESVYGDGDRSQDAHHLAGQMLDLSFSQMMQADAYRDSTALTPWPSTTTTTSTPVQTATPEKRLKCPDCQAVCKTKSELTKHEQRHRKAHRCDVPGCTRKEGFGTLNDLERHRSSVHPDRSTAPRYRCNIGPCLGKDKMWPRADNFRQHLKRVHQRYLSAEDDMSEYVVQPSLPSQTNSVRPTVQDDLEGVGSDMPFPFPQDTSAQWDGRSLALDDVHPDPHQPMDIDIVLAPSLSAVEPMVTSQLRASPTEMFMVDIGNGQQLKSHPPASTDKSVPFDVVENAQRDVTKDVSNQETSRKPRDLLASRVQNSTPAPDTCVEYYLCPHKDCSKQFPRKCELKKHVKRHEKPYGCTHPGCSKKFGSKNDWKRHENSQHFQLEVWKCDRETGLSSSPSSSATPATCGKICHRRETFRTHLQKEHKMTVAEHVDRALNNCRSGRNCDSRFWCGFCVGLVDTSRQGANSWHERFDHIDKHFAGRDGMTPRDISDWKHGETELPEMEPGASKDDEESDDAEPCDDAVVVVSASEAGRAKRKAEDYESSGKDAKRNKTTTIIQGWGCCECEMFADVRNHAYCVGQYVGRLRGTARRNTNDR